MYLFPYTRSWWYAGPADDCALDGAWTFDVFTDNSDPPPSGSTNYLQFESDGDFVNGYVRD